MSDPKNSLLAKVLEQDGQLYLEIKKETDNYFQMKRLLKELQTLYNEALKLYEDYLLCESDCISEIRVLVTYFKNNFSIRSESTYVQTFFIYAVELLSNFDNFDLFDRFFNYQNIFSNNYIFKCSVLRDYYSMKSPMSKYASACNKLGEKTEEFCTLVETLPKSSLYKTYFSRDKFPLILSDCCL